MTRGSINSAETIMKWLATAAVAAILIYILPSCQGGTNSEKNVTGLVTAGTADKDSLIVMGEVPPADAPAPPPPPAPLPYNVNNGDTVWFRADQEPVFPGGASAMNSYIATHIVYPKSAIRKKLQGRMVIGFILTAECEITDAKIITGCDAHCEQEALRVINSLPRFEKPAYVNGRPVAYHYTIPIHFTLK